MCHLPLRGTLPSKSHFLHPPSWLCASEQNNAAATRKKLAAGNKNALSGPFLLITTPVISQPLLEYNWARALNNPSKAQARSRTPRGDPASNASV
jgi:hypothetical protein